MLSHAAATLVAGSVARVPGQDAYDHIKLAKGLKATIRQMMSLSSSPAYKSRVVTGRERASRISQGSDNSRAACAALFFRVNSQTQSSSPCALSVKRGRALWIRGPYQQRPVRVTHYVGSHGIFQRASFTPVTMGCHNHDIDVHLVCSS